MWSWEIKKKKKNYTEKEEPAPFSKILLKTRGISPLIFKIVLDFAVLGGKPVRAPLWEINLPPFFRWICKHLNVLNTPDKDEFLCSLLQLAIHVMVMRPTPIILRYLLKTSKGASLLYIFKLGHFTCTSGKHSIFLFTLQVLSYMLV